MNILLGILVAIAILKALYHNKRGFTQLRQVRDLPSGILAQITLHRTMRDFKFSVHWSVVGIILIWSIFCPTDHLIWAILATALVVTSHAISKVASLKTITPPNKQLLKLADKYPVPQEWYDEQ